MDVVSLSVASYILSYFQVKVFKKLFL